MFIVRESGVTTLVGPAGKGCGMWGCVWPTCTPQLHRIAYPLQCSSSHPPTPGQVIQPVRPGQEGHSTELGASSGESSTRCLLCSRGTRPPPLMCTTDTPLTGPPLLYLRPTSTRARGIPEGHRGEHRFGELLQCRVLPLGVH